MQPVAELPPDLQNFHLRVTTMKWHPYTDLTQSPEGEIQVRGPMGNILRSVVERYNFTYKASIPIDRQWGVVFPNDSATGMIGMLVRNESDWAVNAFGQTHDRLRVVTLSSEFMVQHLSILAGRTFGFKDNYFGIFEAFTIDVWLFLLALVIIMPTILVMSRLLERNEDNINNTSVLKMLSLYGKFFDNIAKSTVFQGIVEQHLPKGSSGRILMGLWLITIFLTMNIFQGTMKASLLVSSGSSKINSLKDVAQRSKIRPIIWKGTAYHVLFQTADMDVYRTVYNRALERNGILAGGELYTPQIFKKILQGRSVIINEQSSMMYNLGKSCESLTGYPGEFYFAKEPVYTHGLSMTLRKTLHPSLKRLINKTIRELQETGNIYKWMRKAMAEFFTCEMAGGAAKKEEHTVSALGFSKVKGPLVLYGIGLSFSLIALFAEMLNNKHQKEKPTTQNPNKKSKKKHGEQS